MLCHPCCVPGGTLVTQGGGGGAQMAAQGCGCLWTGRGISFPYAAVIVFLYIHTLTHKHARSTHKATAQCYFAQQCESFPDFK